MSTTKVLNHRKRVARKKKQKKKTVTGSLKVNQGTRMVVAIKGTRFKGDYPHVCEGSGMRD